MGYDGIIPPDEDWVRPEDFDYSTPSGPDFGPMWTPDFPLYSPPDMGGVDLQSIYWQSINAARKIWNNENASEEDRAAARKSIDFLAGKVGLDEEALENYLNVGVDAPPKDLDDPLPPDWQLGQPQDYQPSTSGTNVWGAPTDNPDFDPTGIFNEPESPIANKIQDLIDAAEMLSDPLNSPQIGVQVNPGGVDAGLLNFPTGFPTNVKVLDADGNWVLDPNNNPLPNFEQKGGVTWGIPTDEAKNPPVETDPTAISDDDIDDSDILGDAGDVLDDILTGDDPSQDDDDGTGVDLDETIGEVTNIDEDTNVIADILDGDDTTVITDIDGDGTTETPPDDTGIADIDGDGTVETETEETATVETETEETATTVETETETEETATVETETETGGTNVEGTGNVGGEGGSGGSVSFLEKLFGNLTNTLKNNLSNIGNAAVNYYGNEKAADAFAEQSDLGRAQAKDMYDADVKRLDPYNQQLGIDNLTAVNAAATNNPEARNMFAGQTDVTATTDIAGPTAGTVAVNQNSPYDVNDPGLKYLMDVGTRAITDQQVGKGKYHSGGTMERLQELGQGAALNRGQQIQSIETQRDTNALNADNQAYKQDLGSSMFDLEQGRGNIANQVGINDQRFGQNLQANNFDQGADLNEYNQLAGLVGIGQNSAAQQGANTGTIADTLGQMSTNQGYADFWKNQKQGNNLSNLFGQMFGSGK